MGPDGGLRIHLLGGLEIEGVPALSVGSRKGRAVLRRLAVARGTAVPAQELVATAWPEGSPVRATDQLAVLVSRLRSVVGSDRLVRRDSGYALLPDWLDVAALEEALQGVAGGLREGAPDRAVSTGLSALALVLGPLLPEEPESEWLDDVRLATERTVAALRLRTAEAALVAGAPAEAAELARNGLDADPYDEHALRLLLQALADSGRLSSALAAYAEVADRLADELGVDPSPETRAVHAALLARTAEPVAAPAPATTLVGREEELARLRTALQEAQAGRPSLVLLRGAGGMGKTTVLMSLAESAPAVVLRAQGQATGSGLPLQPLLDALSVVLRDRADTSTLLGPDAALLEPLLGLRAPARGSTATAQVLASGSGRAAVTTALAGLLDRLDPSRPVLLLVDDAHLLDAPSAALLHHLTRPAAAGRLLVVVAARPGSGPRWDPTSEVEVGALPLAAAEQMVGPERAAALWQRSGGHPLFLAELARWEGELPDTVLRAVTQRCADSATGRVVLQAAAALSELDVDLLAAALGLPVSEVLDELDDGTEQRLLVTTADGYAFRHELFREGLAALVSPARRAVLHRAAAQALARRTGADPARVAHHAAQGGDDVLAAQALTDAAEVAAQRYAHDEALALLDQAVALDPTPARALRRGWALLLTSRYDDAAAVAESCLASDPPAAMELWALAEYLRRDLDHALELASSAAAAATDPEQAAGCLTLAARIEMAHGDLAASEAHLEQARELATGPMRAVAGVWLSLVLGMRDEPERAYRVVRAPETAIARTQPLVEPHRCIALGRSLAMLGRAAEALAAFERLAETVERQHVVRFAGRAENYRGWVLRNLGAAAQADDLTAQAWDVVSALDDVAGAEARGHAVLDLADAALRRADLDGASRWLQEASRTELAPHVMKWRFDLRHELTRGRLALATEDAVAAAEQAASVRRHAQELGVSRFAVQADLLAARAAHHLGERVDRDVLLLRAQALEAVAPLESWWLLADLARELDEPAFARLAGTRVDALLAQAGPWADQLRTAARALLADLPG